MKDNSEVGDYMIKVCIENIDEFKSASAIDFVTKLENGSRTWESLSEKQREFVENLYEQV